MDSLCLEQLGFDQGVSEIFDMDVLHSWITDPPTGPMALQAIEDPLATKQAAPKETEWDEKKPTIEHIYLNENQTLTATMACMRERHGFTATEKMYKRRFRLWGWYKYTTKSQRREKQPKCREPALAPSQLGICEPPGKDDRRQEEQRTSSRADLTRCNLFSLDFKDFHQKATVFTAIKQLLESHTHTSTHSPRPSPSCKFSLLRNSSGPRLLDGVFEALNALDCDARLGWQSMERTFDQIQYHVRDDITSFAELCFLVPRALLFSSQCRALRLYLSRLTQMVQEKNIQGPLAQVGGLLQDVYKLQRESGLLDVLVFAASVFAAALVEIHGKEDRKTLLASWDSLRVAGHLEPAEVSSWLAQWESLHEECMSRFGRHGFQTLGLEDDLAGLVQPTRLYPQTSCPVEIGVLINGVRRKLFLIPSEESGRSNFEDAVQLFL
ncbi:hypothetical protein KVR01_010649 [Diaporthe batatas]|uniref:uncharacterized protein n=1 Tax=Diaporthe batatas TaxID=748121 RepID=UPI001D042481|nr:uncharacterized protein KVR01_010649 [Diaporthe batatas]KAG8160012.1 hypothetical protein KVR01_010649 [Diaporthe batatas]